ncbi:jerky protein homolog-like [Ischnura elegans]|uniref:jerky protein homolog-like n=1 Tax=Ischnura elegans TaxID=197161 RepID=UPI001ED8AEDA|nr:jerky protein homolog-like [Ischnura elegans]
MEAAIGSKRKRKTLSLQQKVELLKKLDRGVSVLKLREEYGVGQSTIYDIKGQREKLLQFVSESDSLAGISKRRNIRGPSNNEVDKVVYEWFRQRRSEGVPISGGIIMEKAKYFHKELQITSPCEYTTGWLQKFKQRHGIRYLKVTGEKLSADHDAAEDYVNELAKLVDEHNLSPDQIYNMDETGLFWRCLPRNTFVCRDEKTASGAKESMERVTIAACSNAAGSHKCKLMVIGKSAKPRVFKGIHQFPVIYRANKRAWITQELFKEWFHTNFVKEVRKNFKALGLPENAKILLLLDNCPAHPPAETLVEENVIVSFLPPNCTALIQPLDQGIINSLKCHYRSEVMKNIINRDTAFSYEEFKKEFTLKNAVWCIAEAWDKVTPQVLKRCWSNLLPDFQNRCEETDDIPEFDGFQGPSNDPVSHFINFVKELDADISDEDLKEWNACDNNAPVYQSLTDGEIMDAVTGSTVDEDVTDSDCSSDEEKITTSDAITYAEKLIKYLEQRPSSSNDMEVLHMHRLKNNLIQERRSRWKQVKLTDLMKNAPTAKCADVAATDTACHSTHGK